MKSMQYSAIAIVPVFGVLVGCASGAPCPPAVPASAPPGVTAAPAATATPAVSPAVVLAADPGAPSPAVMRQLPELPVPSPAAEVTQQVGLTHFVVRYSSPGAKGRNVWGELVPYGTLWRAGANAPTRVSWDRAVTIGDATIPAGSYSLFILPQQERFTVVLNRDSKNAGVYGYDEAEDVLRLDVQPKDAPARERMTYVFENTSDAATELVLDWAGKKVVIPITVDTQAHVAESISATMDNAWRPLFNLGRHTLDAEKNPQRALELFQQSIAIHESWWNHWWAAQTLAQLGRTAEAKPHAERARELGKGDAIFDRSFAARVDKAIADWGAK